MPAKILVVDDEPTMQLLIRKAFRKRIRQGELEFAFANNGLEALETLAADPDIDAILSDINMPKMDGLTLLERVSQLKRPTLKTVIISAYGDMTSIRTAMNRGAFDFLTKPINFEDLEITINKTLDHVSQIKEAIQEKKRAEEAREELSRQKALRESERRLIQVLEAVPVGVFVVDATGEAYYTNHAAKSILSGETHAEGSAPRPEEEKSEASHLQGLKQIYSAQTQECYPEERHPLMLALAGESITVDDVELHQGEQEIPLEIAATPIYDEAGAIVYAIAAFQDITERKRIEKLWADYNKLLETRVVRTTKELDKSEATNRAILKAIPDLLLQMNRAGVCLSAIAPDNVSNILAIDRHSIGCPLDKFLPPELAQSYLSYVHRALETGDLQIFEFLVPQDGEQRYAEARIVVSGENEVLAIVRDISDRKKAETALKTAKDAAEAANRAKSTFLASMSHELRTPLNAILGFSQLLAGNDSLTKEQRESLEIINRSGEHLLTLINDILSVSKIEAGRMTLNEEACNLHHLLNSLHDMLQLKSQSKQLTLAFERSPALPEYVKIDKGKLRQVLTNLIGNAIKFTESGGAIVRADAKPIDPQKPEEQTLVFSVEDTGPGIDETELATLFEPFVQTRIGRQSMEGTGLGLSISREFVRLMGGDITVDTEWGRGSTFTFEIKVRAANTGERRKSQDNRRIMGFSVPPDGDIYRILIVEDMVVNRQLLRGILQPLGFEVSEATNGREAIALWETWQPHLILMDIQMPVMSGYEAIEKIRQREGENIGDRPPVPIIALTASALIEDRQKLLDLGGSDFVTKPFRQDNLLEKLSEYLGINYLYEESESNSKENSLETAIPMLEAEDLQGMPLEWLEQLYDAALSVDNEILLELIEHIPPQREKLIASLTNLVNNFRVDIIFELARGELDKQGVSLVNEE
ncbi:response regulator [Spirulina sp. 06S082]|uniref:response regulator n=1 Tax=Spirulina sp. 06S082 TaxID=3110248 RepID=UPI002B217B1F|nr:response regulator [Spirulina sp. 06S082]MEA5470348.1 response regulator [Spirulina sp. 06S082]